MYDIILEEGEKFQHIDDTTIQECMHVRRDERNYAFLRVGNFR